MYPNYGGGHEVGLAEGINGDGKPHECRACTLHACATGATLMRDGIHIGRAVVITIADTVPIMI